MPEPQAAAARPLERLATLARPGTKPAAGQVPRRHRALRPGGEKPQRGSSPTGDPGRNPVSRLATARSMLAKRLSRHRLAMSGAALSAVFAQSAASAAVPATLVSSTIKATSVIATGQGAAGVLSNRVAALTEESDQDHAHHQAEDRHRAVVAGRSGRQWEPLPLGCRCWRPQRRRSRSRPGLSPSKAPSPKPSGSQSASAKTPSFNGLAYSADGKTLATVGTTYEWVEIQQQGQPQKSQIRNCTVKLWDAATGELKRSLGEEKHTTLWALSFSPDRKTAAIAAGKPENPAAGKCGSSMPRPGRCST